MKKERIILIGSVGVEPELEKEGRYVSFKINTESDKSIDGSWWKVIIYGGELDKGILQLLKKGDKLNVIGVPAFNAWSKKNKKGNAVIQENDATIFISKTCISRVEDIIII